MQLNIWHQQKLDAGKKLIKPLEERGCIYGCIILAERDFKFRVLIFTSFSLTTHLANFCKYQQITIIHALDRYNSID